jgi:3-phytase
LPVVALALVLTAGAAAAAALLSPAAPRAPVAVTIRPVLATEPVSGDPDDPAIWVNRAAPARSLLVATNKVAAAEGGALYVFGLDGKIRQKIPGLDRPNNVDVEYGLRLNGKVIDIAVVTERLQRRLRVYRIATNGLTEIARLPVFENEPGERAAPMGIALYKRRRDNAVFAIVGRKTGPADGYLWQYRLLDDGRGNLVARKARAFGRFSGVGEIEAIAVDDALGYVYYADEATGIRKYHADPEHKNAARELALFGTTGFSGDREGIGIYARPKRRRLYRLHGPDPGRARRQPLSCVPARRGARPRARSRAPRRHRVRGRRRNRWNRDHLVCPAWPTLPRRPVRGDEQRRAQLFAVPRRSRRSPVGAHAAKNGWKNRCTIRTTQTKQATRRA